jgi:hypothetical protein
LKEKQAEDKVGEQQETVQVCDATRIRSEQKDDLIKNP